MIGDVLINLAQVVLVALFIGAFILSMANGGNSEDDESDQKRSGRQSRNNSGE